MRRNIIRSALIAFGLLIAVLAAYVIYVFADYHRFEGPACPSLPKAKLLRA